MIGVEQRATSRANGVSDTASESKPIANVETARPDCGGGGDDDARIDAARKKEPERHVGDHLLARPTSAINARSSLAALLERRPPRLRRHRDGPVTASAPRTAPVAGCTRAGARAAACSTLVECLRRGHVAIAQEVVERAAVDLELRAPRSALLDRLELRRKREPAAVVVIVERLDARADRDTA